MASARNEKWESALLASAKNQEWEIVVVEKWEILVGVNVGVHVDWNSSEVSGSEG